MILDSRLPPSLILIQDSWTLARVAGMVTQTFRGSPPLPPRRAALPPLARPRSPYPQRATPAACGPAPCKTHSRLCGPQLSSHVAGSDEPTPTFLLARKTCRREKRGEAGGWAALRY